MRSKIAGFTLIELMIVVAIIGVLAAIAYPNYQQHMQKSRRSDAQVALVQMAAAQERWYLQNNTYTNVLANVGCTDLAGICTENRWYTLSIPVANASTFTLTATPVAGGAQANDLDCTTITLNSAGQRGWTGGVNTCWR